MGTKIKKDTIARTIVLAIALLNQILAVTGKEIFPVTEEQVYQMVTLLVTIGAAVWAWWENNSFTRHAILADEYLKELNEGESCRRCQ